MLSRRRRSASPGSVCCWRRICSEARQLEPANLMNLWGRLGISVAFAAALSSIMAESLQATAYYEKFKWHLCVGFLIAGLVLMVIGHFVNACWRARKRARKDTTDPECNEQPEAPLLLFNLAYWGVMLVVFAGITVFIIPRPKVVVAAVTATVAPRTNHPPAAPLAVATNEIVTTRSFPNLALQGVTYAKQNSTVLINGKTLRTGERIHEAKVVEITPTGAVIEFDGETKRLTLDK